MADELKAYWDEEAGCFKEYNDEFDLTIHFETEEEKDSFVKSIENYDKLKEAIGKIKAEISVRLIQALDIIEKHMEGLI